MDSVFLDRLIERAQEDIVQGPHTRPEQTPIGEPPYTRADPNRPDERYPTANVVLRPSNKNLRVKVADTPALRKVGFQNTAEPTDYDGLLFKYPGDARASLHNAGVDFPVSATWFDSSGMYVDHAHMLPEDATPKHPKAEHRYILEVPSRDWDALGLGPGASMSVADEKDQSRNGTVQLGEDKPGEIK